MIDAIHVMQLKGTCPAGPNRNNRQISTAEFATDLLPMSDRELKGGLTK
ncbi:hypothetical protein [Cryptosporangium phraense]|nr:hypothetical protein [Cryptosporangium phraense]